MLCKRKVSKTKKRMRKILLSAAAVLIILIAFFEIQAIPFTKKCVKKQSETISTRIIADAIRNVSEKYSVKYDDFAIIKYSDLGDLKAISENTAFVNKFKAAVTLKIQDELDKEKLYRFSLPLGAFTDITMLSTVGPSVEISFVLTGSVNCKLKSKFESAGINQTIHHIMLVIKTDIITISPEYSEQTSFKTEYEIAQTVIVGSVPSTFADIVR